MTRRLVRSVLDVVNDTHGALELDCEDFAILVEGPRHVTRYFYEDGSSIDVTIEQHEGPTGAKP